MAPGHMAASAVQARAKLLHYQFECPDWNLPIVTEQEKLEWYAFERWLHMARTTDFLIPSWDDALEATARKAAKAAKADRNSHQQSRV